MLFRSSGEEKPKVGRIFLKPKITKEKESSREKSKENSSLLISVPNPVISSVEIRTGIKALRLVRPHAPPSGEIGPEDSWLRVLKGSDNRLPKDHSSK